MLQPQSLGRAASPVPPCPSFLDLRFYAEYRWETEARGGGHYSPHVLSMPRFPCQPWLVLSVCPSPWHVPHPDSHAHGHGQLSTSFQAGAGVSTGGERGNRVPPGQTPQEGLEHPPAESIPVKAAGCQAALRPAWRLSPLAEAPQLRAWMSADPSPSPIPGPPRGLGWGWEGCIPLQDPLEAGGGMRVTWVAGVPRSEEEMDPKCV